MSSTKMVLAEMATEHFTFRALGADEDCAKSAILRGWEKHVKSYGDYHQMPWDGKTANEIEEWYGINTYSVEMNECLRDDVVLNVR